jgi:hypothetical protein
MAFVEKVEPELKGMRSTHPTVVTAKYMVSERDGKKLFQLNTYGSRDREMPDKLSQTLQFSEKSARALWEVIGKTYGFR